MNTNQTPNLLINEKSTYLLQHAYNPVNWYPWREDAFELAKKENKPIFLSIGYSTCHWCHVMEHESFEDEKVAKLMNENFINIKVDREERPDIDAVYMEVLQKMTGQGGWPMTVLLTPDKKPFFAGTYFPKNNLGNRIGMIELIPKIKEAWDESYFEIIESSNNIVESLSNVNEYKNENEINLENLQNLAFNFFVKNFDIEYGGFGIKPKFPSPHNLTFLLNYFEKTQNEESLNLALKTLDMIQMGGINDHIGGGYHRYSTDQQWLVPHFEKMLYDNALLITAFSKAYLITKELKYQLYAKDIIQYVISDMMLENMMYASARDADSEGIEGKFYVWEYDEVRSILENEVEWDIEDNIDDNNEDKTEMRKFIDIFLNYYNITKEGNYLDEVTHQKNGKNIFHITKNSKKYLEDIMPIESDEFINWEDFQIEALDKLNEIRKERIHPILDEKVLTDWNGLVISSMIDNYISTLDFEMLGIAEMNYNFLIQNLFTDDILKHCYVDNSAKINGFLDDYAYLIKASFSLYKATLNVAYLLNAISFLDESIKLFYDKEKGGFFQSGKYNEELIYNKKEIYDGAIPSGNSVMIENLIIAFNYTNDLKYNEIKDKTLKYFSNQLKASPGIFGYLMNSFYQIGKDDFLIIIAETILEIEEFIEDIIESGVNTILLTEELKGDLIEKIPFLGNYKRVNNTTTYYLCKNFVCHQPTNDFDELMVDILQNK
jgi:uncharacterized protein YyaL (SSP411 family)